MAVTVTISDELYAELMDLSKSSVIGCGSKYAYGVGKIDGQVELAASIIAEIKGEI